MNQVKKKKNPDTGTDSNNMSVKIFIYFTLLFYVMIKMNSAQRSSVTGGIVKLLVACRVDAPEAMFRCSSVTALPTPQGF